MQLPDFFKHVATLIKPASAIKPTLTDKRIALVHSALGVADEIFEIAELVAAYPSSGTMPKLDLIEELGDLLFYTIDLAHIVGHSPESFDEAFAQEYAPYPNDAAAFLDLCKAGMLVVSYSKKVFAYNDVDKEAKLKDLLDPAFRLIVRVLNHYAIFYGLQAGAILAANYDKLKDRYPQGYTDKAAAARADKQDPLAVLKAK
jgi:NTP pyrophosphatase (non-canonical NTP hydrolase)